ncbi:hypothetical protein PVIIG_06254 [Plasmodium vivax India VII]|uniref:PIR Superfamily Protein n=1 Tax=Plasmodium vivax India VII TaxID=1077284 RepID=A0A0J9S3D2_PLAVI|nr:hypothetical protein PVIIG_06254 [Plasmodium vivax India VII]
MIGKNYKDFYYDFSDVKSEFSSVDDNYLDVIKTMEDPILQHISLYLVNNYKNAKSYFCKSSKPSDDIACSNLNRWLDQKKNIYTSATNCTKNSEAWTKHIVPLWNLLDQNNNGTKCIRKEIFSKNSNFPEKLKPYTCHKHVPQNYTYTDPKAISLTTEDPCSKFIVNRCVLLKYFNFNKSLQNIFNQKYFIHFKVFYFFNYYVNLHNSEVIYLLLSCMQFGKDKIEEHIKNSDTDDGHVIKTFICKQNRKIYYFLLIRKFPKRMFI